jgi:hypothetical protein
MPLAFAASGISAFWKEGKEFMQCLPSDRSIEITGKPTAQKKPVTFMRYSYLVLRRARKEAWDERGPNWKTVGAAMASAVALYWWFHKATREAIVIAIHSNWSYLVEAIPPTLITIAAFAILFIVKAAYLLYKESAKDRDQLADLLLTETAKSNPTHKLIFMLDTYPGRSRVQVDDNGLEDESDKTAYCLSATLQLSFVNTDINPVLIKTMSLSIVTASEEEVLLPEFCPATWRSNTFESTYFRGFSVPASHPPSDDYWFKFVVDVPYECAKSLDPKSFLRVTMDAARQDLYFVDLVINWKAAKRGDSSIVCLRTMLNEIDQ